VAFGKINRYQWVKAYCIIPIKMKSQKATIALLLLFFVWSTTQAQQPAYPSTINVAGQSSTVGNYALEWSVGESAAITTMNNNNLLVTNGLLQYNVENQPEVNLIASFLPGEIRIYPNPVKNILHINILHANKGKHQIELLDVIGAKLKQVQLYYNGMGALESWNLGGLPAGQYILNIRQTHPVTGRLVKKGAYKILKIN
jgi:Secretion system C-terminal sorting domain